MESEQQKFLSDLDIKKDDSVLEKPLTEAEPEKEEAEDTDQRAKNRRERRLLEQNQRLREEAIVASTRLQTLTESRNLREGATEAEYLKRIEKIYGNATPEAKEATELLKEAFIGAIKTAKEESVQEVEKLRGSESQAVAEEEKNLDEILDSVEEDYGINMEVAANRQGFLTLMEKLSPKDKEGNIVEYADKDAVAEVFKSTQQKDSSRAKDLASRSMTRSGQSQPSKLEADSVERELKALGII